MSVDNRIVEMQFNNAEFERGVRTTLESLDALKKGLQLDGAAKGLEDVASAGKRFSLGNMLSSISGVQVAFGALAVSAITVLSNIVNKATEAGLSIAKSLTVAPVMDGLKEYETNLNSIQTILANTKSDNTNLDQVTGALEELNEYSDKTIYNFAQMARNIGTFTAAGVDLDTSVGAIKGIANLAAVSGSSADQASTAMYQLSQALSTGTVKLMDWNSIVNAGMGGEVFQEALKETARVQGVAVDEIITKNGSFRDSLQEGWLTSGILTDTLAKFTGDLTAQQLEAMGYTQDQITGILEMGVTAQDAATKIKTVSQLINTLQESATSGWAKSFELLFGDFEEAKNLFTGVNDILGGMINNSADARNKLLSEWKELGGRDVLIEGISNAFKALMGILGPIKEAFREIFPAMTAQRLFELTEIFRDFTAGLIIGADTAENLKRTFAGVFAILGIGWEIIKAGVGFLLDLFGTVTEGSGSFLETTASIGDFLVSLLEAIKKGEGLTKFFDKLAEVIAVPINLIKTFASSLLGAFDGLDGPELGSFGDAALNSLSPLAALGENIAQGWERVKDVFDRVKTALGPIGEIMGTAFTQIKTTLGEFFAGLDYEQILAGIQTGLLAGIVILLKNFLGNFTGVSVGGGGFLSSISDSFGQLTDTLGAMQNTLRAATLLQIALAIGILTLSVIGLSTIDSEGLKKALAAMTIMFTQLMASMAVFAKIGGAAGFAKLPLVAAGLILLAIAIGILTSSVKRLSGLSWEELAKGLTGVTVLITALVAAAAGLGRYASSMITTGAGLILLAIAIRILVGAVTDLAGMSWEELAKGLVSVGLLLTALSLFTQLSEANRGGLASSAGLILLAIAIKILASAVGDFAKSSWEDLAKGLVAISAILAAFAIFSKTVGNPVALVASGAALILVGMAMKILAEAMAMFGNLSWEEIAKGLLSMSVALAAIAIALGSLPPSTLLSAAAILVVAASLQLIATALQSFGGMSWEEIAKGLIVLAASLTIMVIALNLMSGTIAGSAALLLAAGALAILAPVLAAFGSMSLEEIAKSMLVLAGVFVVLGLAGLVLAPLAPVLLLLGGAVLLLGIGMLAAGAGVLAFSIALTALAAAGAAGTAAIIGIVAGLIGLIPLVMKSIGEGIVAFAEVIATAGPAILAAISAVLNAFLDAIRQAIPKAVTIIFELVNKLLNALVQNVPKLIASGVSLIVAILDGIAQAVPRIARSAANLIVAFLNAIGDELPKIIRAGANMIIKFINGVADAVRNEGPRLAKAGANLADAIIDGMVKGLKAGVGAIGDAAKGVAQSALNSAKGLLGINSPSKEFEKIGEFVNDGFAKGLLGNRAQVDDAFNKLSEMLTNVMRSAEADVKRLEEKQASLTAAREKDTKAIRQNAVELAVARNELAVTAEAHQTLTEQLLDEQLALGDLGEEYETLTKKIDESNKALETAMKQRDDYNTSIQNSYGKLPDIGKDTKLTDYLTDAEKKYGDVTAFLDALQQLRAQGLNDDVYKDILAKGLDAMPFVQQLLASGPESVRAINQVSERIKEAALVLGITSAAQLYDAGVEAARGIVEGLKSQQTEIGLQMKTIAETMIGELKKQLGIKSPSKEFAKLGGWSVKGLAQGLAESTIFAVRAAKDVGAATLDSLTKTMSNLSTVVAADMDMSPTITPVLDLSAVQRDAGRVGAILGTQAMLADASFGQASRIATVQEAARAAQPTTQADIPAQMLKFEQNNYSPKALSPAEIYRNTRSQLSLAKEVLNVS